MLISCRGEINKQWPLNPGLDVLSLCNCCLHYLLDDIKVNDRHGDNTAGRSATLGVHANPFITNPSTFQTVPLRLHHLTVVLASIQEYDPSLVLLLLH